MALRLTDKMERRGTKCLQDFRQQIWNEKRDQIGFLPPMAILPDSHIKTLLGNFARLKEPQDLAPYVSNLHHLDGHHDRLFSVIVELRGVFATLPPPKRKARPTALQTVPAAAATGVSDKAPADMAPDNQLTNPIPSAPETTSTTTTPSTSTVDTDLANDQAENSSLSAPTTNPIQEAVAAPTYDTFWSSFSKPAPLVTLPLPSQSTSALTARTRHVSYITRAHLLICEPQVKACQKANLYRGDATGFSSESSQDSEFEGI